MSSTTALGAGAVASAVAPLLFLGWRAAKTSGTSQAQAADTAGSVGVVVAGGFLVDAGHGGRKDAEAGAIGSAGRVPDLV
jgi:predicted sugar kinase